MLKPEEISAYVRLIQPENFPLYCSTMLKIQSKGKGLIPLNLNPSQLRMHNAILTRRREGKAVRLILLKARQQGFSTFTEAYCYKQTTTNHDFRAAIIAHDGFTSNKIYKMFRIYDEGFRRAYPELCPARKSPGNSKEMVFDKLRSEINVLTAENALGSSGGTFQFVHISELSKWSNAEEAMLSLMQTLPMSADVIVESTAYGVGNYFYRMWRKAVEGEIDFVPLFFPWFEHPEYKIPLDKGECITPAGKEPYYVERFGSDVITRERLKWMRWALKNNCDADEDLFAQEYPAYPEESFLSSGRPVFDMDMLQTRELGLRKNPYPMERGDFILREGRKDNGDTFTVDWCLSPGGVVEIYEHPPDKCDLKHWAYRYVVSADICEGIDRAIGGDERSINTDYNAVAVWDRISERTVALSTQKLDPDQVAVMVFCFMEFYGQGMDYSYYPLAIIERNGPGLSTILYLRDLLKKYGVPLSRMYHRGTMDVNYEPTTEMLGFRTSGGSGGTKDPLIGEMIRRVREGADGICSLKVIEEAKVFVRDEKGRMNAQAGMHDDTVIMTALGYEGARRDHPPYEVKKKLELTGWRLDIAKLAGRRKHAGYWSAQR